MTTKSDGPLSVPPATLDDMGDPITDQLHDTVGDQQVGRRLPRALTPFRTPGLPLAGARARRELVRGRGLDRRAGLGGHPPRRWPGPALHGDDGQRDRRTHPGAPGRRRRRPGAAEADPAHGRAHRAGGDDAGRVPVLGRPQRRLGAGVRHVRDRHGHGVLLPRLLRLAARADPRVRPAGGQRLRGDGAPDDRAGDRTRRGRCRGRRLLTRDGVHGRRGVVGRRARRARQGPADPDPAHPRRGARAPPDPHGLRRHARGLRLHDAHAVAAGHAALRVADDPGDDGPARGADPVPDQGQARRRPRRPLLRPGRLRHRRRRSARWRWRRSGCRGATSR